MKLSVSCYEVGQTKDFDDPKLAWQHFRLDRLTRCLNVVRMLNNACGHSAASAVVVVGDGCTAAEGDLCVITVLKDERDYRSSPNSIQLFRTSQQSTTSGCRLSLISINN